MRRRELLTLAGTGAAGALAGCAIPFTGGSDGGGGGGGTPEPTQPSYDRAVEFLDSKLVRDDAGTFAETVEVQGTAKNTSSVALEGVQIRVRFLSESGEELGVRATSGRNVAPGRTWSFTVQFAGNGSEAAAVKDYELTAGEEFEAPSGTPTE